jgi:hypothetical protein
MAHITLVYATGLIGKEHTRLLCRCVDWEVGLIGNGIEHNGDMLKNDIEHVIKVG